MTKITCHIIIIFLLLFSACNSITESPAQNTKSNTKGIIKIAAPNGNTVGNEIKILIETENKAEDPIILLVDNGLTIRTIYATTNQSITLLPDWLKKSGLYKLTAIHNNTIIATRKLRIKSADISEPLEVYTGPVTILVNGQEESMLTYIPADRYDNGITQATSISYTSTKDSNKNETGTVRNLISYNMHRSNTKAEKILLGVQAEKFASPEQSVEEIADWPVDIKISIVNHHSFADNRQYTRLKTDKLYDAYGNQIADGTLLTFYQLQDGKLYGTYKSIVVDGVTNAYLRNPREAGQYQIQAVAGTVTSNTLRLDYARLINEIPTNYDSLTKILQVGPLVSSLGQLVPEGTEVVLNNKDEELIKETIHGSVSFELSQIKFLSNSIVINSGGLSKTIKL